MELRHWLREQLGHGRGRRAVLALLAVAALASAAAPAHARRVVVRWRQPSPHGDELFKVHVGRQPGDYRQVLYVGSLIRSRTGVYALSLPVPDGAAYIAVSAYNRRGESPLSNEEAVAASVGRGRGRGEGDGAAEDESGGGRSSVSWPQEEELHASLASHAEGREGGLELRGRLQIEDPAGGIGVTLREPFATDAFYWLARDPEPGAAFALASSVSTLQCEGDLPAPEAGIPYRFRFAVRAQSDATELRAKVWPADEREPREWARCLDASASRLVTVAPGLWGVGPGEKSWDRLRARPPRG